MTNEQRGLKQPIIIEFVAKMPNGHECVCGSWTVPAGSPAKVLPDTDTSESLGWSIQVAFMDGASEVIVRPRREPHQ